MAESNCPNGDVQEVEIPKIELIDSSLADNPQKDSVEASKGLNINSLPEWPLLWEDAKKVRKDLDEPFEPDLLGRLAQVLWELGGEAVRGLVAQAQTIHQGEGMLVVDGSRKRTLGGIFFYLAKPKIDPKVWMKISPFKGIKSSPQTGQTTQTHQVTQVTPLTEDELKQIKQEFWAQVKQAGNWEKGEATTVKITLVGRPGQIQQNSTYVMFTMESKPPASLPKGLPELTAPTNYLLMVALKQWQKVEKALAANPEDIIIAEGHSTIVPTFRGIAVLVQSIATKEQQKQLQLAKQEKANTTKIAP